MKKLLNSFAFFLLLCITACTPEPGDTSQTQASSGMFELVELDSERGMNIDRYLSAVEAFGFSGSIIVSEGEKIVLKKGYGLADRSTRSPYTPATVQSHGSLTKQMTAAAILLLERRGEISVDERLTTYLDAVPEDKKNITIHQLLTHTSGMPGGIGHDEEQTRAQEYLERALAAPLEYEPGSGYAYSNTGYALLGILVERVSGQSYEAFLREHLLLPAGLTQTGYVLPEWDTDQLAQGYLRGEYWGVVHNRSWLEDGPGWHLRANGGMHTTVGDMYQWYRNVLQNKAVLGDEAVTRWTTGHVPEGNSESRYGYGWVSRNTDWGPMISHSGSNRIFSADFVWLPEQELFFYIQSNTSMFSASAQRRSILSAAFDTAFQQPPLVQPFANARPEMASARAGIYRLEDGQIELAGDDIRLNGKLSGQSALNLVLKPAESQRKQYEDLNRRTREAMDRVEAGQPDALASIIGSDEDPVEATRPLLNRIEQIGNLKALNLIGSFENVPGSRLAPYGMWTTFVHAEFANWNQYWNIVWNGDGTYRGTFSGPWPALTLVPTSEGRYIGVREGIPWDTIEINFEENCMVVEMEHACQ